MLKNLLKHFSKKKEDEKKTQTFQPLYRKYDRIINQQLAKDILLGTAIGDALGFPVQFIPRETVQKDPVIGMGKCRTFESPSGIWSDDIKGFIIRCPESLKQPFYKFAGYVL